MITIKEINWLNDLHQYLNHTFRYNALSGTTVKEMNHAINGSICHQFDPSKLDSFLVKVNVSTNLSKIQIIP